MSDLTQVVTLDDVCELLTAIRDRLDASARPPAELLTRDDMAHLLNMGVSTFDRLKAAGKIGPQPVELAGVKYSAAETRAWLSARDPAGELYDTESWPAVWVALQPARTKNR